MRVQNDQGIMIDLTGMNITMASGKGGTGKTTVAVNFAWLLASAGQRVQYLDCDVEEPNGHIFLKPSITESAPSKVMVPVVDQEKCTSCGECGLKCQFHAIVNLPGDTLIFPGLCHSCGLCSSVCPTGAITEGDREIGIIGKGSGTKRIDFIHGVLNVGEAMAVPLIKKVKNGRKDPYVHIIDAPPGTSCPVVATLKGSDAVIMVTEPTPFGLHDLKIAIDVARLLNIPTGVVINRDQGGYQPLSDYLEAAGIPILAVIPEDADIARHYSQGGIILESLPHYIDVYETLAANLEKLLDTHSVHAGRMRS
ncbi:MAG: ATP-binding protein [Syntrophorhabdaceae bacterium]|nr:ATP-binding protein [Syntrophorhabdaceae bacterium]